MTITELMPHIENLSQDDKTQIFQYLLKDLGAEEDYLMGCIHNPTMMASAVQTLQELFKEDAKATV